MSGRNRGALRKDSLKVVCNEKRAVSKISDVRYENARFVCF
jgi:hypothetical protein